MHGQNPEYEIDPARECKVRPLLARLEMRLVVLRALTSRHTNPSPPPGALPRLEMRLVVLRALTSRHTNPLSQVPVPEADDVYAYFFDGRQVRVWPAWKCV